MFVLFKNIQGGELNIIGQSKVMRLKRLIHEQAAEKWVKQAHLKQLSI